MEEEKLGQESAFPLEANRYEPHFGMSKRFYAACAAMQGLIIADSNNIGIIAITTQAYKYADELLKQENQ